MRGNRSGTKLSASMVMALLLVGCEASPAPIAAPAAVPSERQGRIEPAAGASSAAAKPACAEDDIECIELHYQLQETLLMYEAGVARTLPAPAQPCWQADSAAFAQVLDRCDDLTCRETALRERLASLHELQTEDRRASLPLPQAPILIAVLAPESESVAAPRTPAPMETQGSLVHAATHPEHMGIAVRTAEGEDRVFIHDMEISAQPGHDEVLGLVGASPTARVLVRGQAHEPSSASIANFDTAACRLVYQLP